MPGKKDPEYFPLNLNMSGIGGFYGDESPLSAAAHHGKFEYGSGMSPPLNMSFNVSIPPVNSEEDDTDDESSSVTGSDIDVDMDTLVYSIREKLKMSPKFSSGGSGNSNSANPGSNNYWAEPPHPHHRHHHRHHHPDEEEDEVDEEDEEEEEDASPCVVSPSVVANSGSVGRRCRNHPYSHSQWRHSIHNHHHHHHHHNSHHSHSNYHHRQIINGGIQKQHKSNIHNHWWTSKSFNDISRVKKNPEGPPTDPYSLLQELIESGSLIKEAVRRINLKQKRFTSINANANSSLTKKFTYRDEDTENSYPPMPMSAP